MAPPWTWLKVSLSVLTCCIFILARMLILYTFDNVEKFSQWLKKHTASIKKMAQTHTIHLIKQQSPWRYKITNSLWVTIIKPMVLHIITMLRIERILRNKDTQPRGRVPFLNPSENVKLNWSVCLSCQNAHHLWFFSKMVALISFCTLSHLPFILKICCYSHVLPLFFLLCLVITYGFLFIFF